LVKVWYDFYEKSAGVISQMSDIKPVTRLIKIILQARQYDSHMPAIQFKCLFGVSLEWGWNSDLHFCEMKYPCMDIYNYIVGIVYIYVICIVYIYVICKKCKSLCLRSRMYVLNENKYGRFYCSWYHILPVYITLPWDMTIFVW
jgi:hypothetical protein